MQGLPLIQNARIADKMGLFGHLRRFEKIRKKTYIIYHKNIKQFYFTVPKMAFLPSQAPAQETIVILAMAFILERPMPRHCPLYARNRTPLSILFAILWMT